MIRKSGRRLALLGVAGITLAQGTAMAATPVRLTQPVNATKADQNPDRTYSAPYLVVDPTNQLNVVGSYIDLRTRRCGVIRSTDGGQTWKQLDASPAAAAYPSCLSTSRNIFMAPAAFGRDGTLYVASPGWDIQDRAQSGGNSSIQLARSTDLGNSWQTTLVRDNRGKQNDQLESARPVGGVAVDTKTGSDDIVYVAYSFSTPGVTAPNANPGKVAVAVSTNGGRSFGPPVVVSDSAWTDQALRAKAISAVAPTTTVPNATTTTTTIPPAGSRAAQPNQAANFGSSSPTITTDNKGDVYVYWQSSTANITPSPMTGLFVAKSTDHGKTWTSTQVAPFDRGAGTLGRLAWTKEGGADGTLHLVLQVAENPDVNGSGAIYYTQSTDGGKTWSQRKRISDGDPTVSSLIPNISVAPNGRIDVDWWDTRDDPGVRGNDVYYSYSTDNGKTWSKNIRITDQSDSRLYGVWGTNFDMTSPPGIASTNNYAIFSWDDTRNTDTSFKDAATTGGGVSDIFTADAQFAAVGAGSSKAAKVVLAGVAGLVAVGLVLLVVALASRRRAGPPKPSKAAAKAPASVR
jgi:hypothetical protein